MSRTIFLVFLSFAALVTCADDRYNLKICSKRGKESECQQIARNEIGCTIHLHDVDCLQALDYDRADFGRINSEVAWLGANLIGDDIIVVGSIENQDASPFQTAVLIKKELIIDNNFNDIKGRKFCHPGSKNVETISKALLEELENKIISNEELCSSTATLIENRFKSLSTFLGDSCRPGPWTSNDKLDKQLKSKYPSLCKLCANQNCDVTYEDPFNDTLSCLQNGGEIALTSLREAKIFMANPDNARSYTYLCSNGKSNAQECPWSGALPNLIVANRNKINDVNTLINKYFPSSITTFSTDVDTISKAFKNILNLEKSEKIKLIAGQTKLRDYVNAARPVPTVEKMKRCDTTAKWCTHSDAEQKKCEWLSQAALNEGIYPAIECVHNDDNELSCLQKLNQKEADIVTASASQAYITLKENLVSIAYPETEQKHLNTILLVKRDNNDNIKSFSDLKSKNLCLPLYGGQEFLSFIEAAKSKNVIDKKSCLYDDLLNNFISKGCLPGVRSPYLSEIIKSEDEHMDKFCELCEPADGTNSPTQSNCNDDISNKYYGSIGALRCVNESVADYAVITRNHIPQNSLLPPQMRVLCKNNTLAAYPGLNVDDDCALNVITTSEVVVRKDNEQKDNLLNMLYEYEKYFGQNLDKRFHIFDVFNNTKNLMFADSTPGLTFPDDEKKIEWVENYKTLLKHAGECSAGQQYHMTFGLLIITIIFLFN